MKQVKKSKTSLKDWKAEYDVYKEGISNGRIDIADVVAMIKEIQEQDKLRAAIKAANPQAQLPELEIQIEKIMPPFQLTKNEAINEQTIGRWLEKRQLKNRGKFQSFHLLHCHYRLQ